MEEYYKKYLKMNKDFKLKSLKDHKNILTSWKFYLSKYKI